MKLYSIRLKNATVFLLFALVITSGRSQDPRTEKTDNLSQYVNPNIGTAHSRWFFYTPAAVPFGMAKLAPSTNGSYGNPSGWEAVGYDARHNSIEGFASFHEFQIGGILTTGITGPLQTVPGTLEDPDSGYRSRFNKRDEIAKPGYYKVLLKDHGVQVELTATKRTAWQRYTFPESDRSYLIFDIGNQLGESGKVKDARVTYNPDGSIEGYVITYPKYVEKYQSDGDIKMYFYSRVSQTPDTHGTFRKMETFPGQDVISGIGSGLYLHYNTSSDEQIDIRTGLSYTSIANARHNLEEEAEKMTFDAVRAQAESVWERELGKIHVKDASKENKTKFYTALFHALLGRGLSSDCNGAFPRNDGSVGQIPMDDKGEPGFQVYNTDSVWGAFWNLTQLWALVWPEYFNDFIQGQLEVYKNAGWLGDGIANGRYVSGVGTNYVGLMIASGYQTGRIADNIDMAYEAALKNEVEYRDRKPGAGKVDLRGFVEEGYVSFISLEDSDWSDAPDGSPFSVSHSLEYAFSSYAVAQMAKGLGHMEDHRKLMELSENWKNLFDHKTGFFRPRLKGGAFLKDFDPLEPWVGFQEGNAWQYSYYVPHDPNALIKTIGRETFNTRLDSLFTKSAETRFGGNGIDAFAGVQSLYNHGNQPSLHISWMFNFSGKPWLTQKWTRRIGNEFYGTEEIHGYGYGQDEDQGQLGAWYVMSSLGLFDIKGLTETNPGFQFGSPIFDLAILQVDGGSFTIRTHNNGKDKVYINKIEFNGKPYSRSEISFRDLIRGGTLDFWMSATPNKNLFD